MSLIIIFHCLNEVDNISSVIETKDKVICICNFQVIYFRTISICRLMFRTDFTNVESNITNSEE